MFRHEMLLIATCILHGVTLVNSCSCMYMTQQSRFCKSDFVIKVQILQESPPAYPNGMSALSQYFDMGVYQYQIKILKELRTTTKYETARKVLQTQGSDGICGRRLQPGRTYLIGSHIENNLLQPNAHVLGVYSCNLVVDLSWDFADTSLLDSPPDCSDPNVHLSPDELYLLSLIESS